MNDGGYGEALVRHGPRVLYVVYWGALEPLGQALVVPSVLGLARRGARLTLVSYEKPADSVRSAAVRALRRTLESAGVGWVPLTYHKRPRTPATLFDILHGSVRAALLARRVRAEVVHARTFVGGMIGLGAARLGGGRLVYHAEGFYADEQVDAGVWRERSPAHRVAAALERGLFARAEGIATLTRAGAAVVRDLPAVRQRHTPVAVVPSAVDLDHFVSWEVDRPSVEEGPRFVYAGSLGGRYLVGEMAAFLAAAREERPNARLTILSWADRGPVTEVFRSAGLPDESWDIRVVPRDEMPRELSRHHAGLHFVRTAASGRGGSPTKVGEYWACGLPVVVSSGLGDLDDIIRSEQVGASVESGSAASFRTALSSLHRIWRDPGSGRRCRRAAEQHYNPVAAFDVQMGLYDAMLRWPL